MLIVGEEFELIVMLLMEEPVEAETGAAFDISHHFFHDKLLLNGIIKITYTIYNAQYILRSKRKI